MKTIDVIFPHQIDSFKVEIGEERFKDIKEAVAYVESQKYKVGVALSVKGRCAASTPLYDQDGIPTDLRLTPVEIALGERVYVIEKYSSNDFVCPLGLLKTR